MHEVTVVVVCVCVCVYVSVCVCVYVCFHTSYYIPHLYVKNKVPLGFLSCFQDMHCVAYIENALFKILVTYANHFCLLGFLTSSQWTKETVMAPFQED